MLCTDISHMFPGFPLVLLFVRLWMGRIVTTNNYVYKGSLTVIHSPSTVNQHRSHERCGTMLGDESTRKECNIILYIVMFQQLKI